MGRVRITKVSHKKAQKEQKEEKELRGDDEINFEFVYVGIFVFGAGMCAGQWEPSSQCGRGVALGGHGRDAGLG